MNKYAFFFLGLLAAFLLGSWVGFTYKHCPPCAEAGTVVLVRDSIIYPKDTTPKLIAKGKPKLSKVGKFKPSNIINPCDSQPISLFSCLDTNTFILDSLSPGVFNLSASAKVTGNEVIDMAVNFVSLLPDTFRIVEKTTTIIQPTKIPFLKVYTGVYAGASLNGQSISSYRGGVGFDGIFVDKHKVGVSLGINSNIQPDLMVQYAVKLKLKK